jgi:hypothetical protein
LLTKTIVKNSIDIIEIRINLNSRNGKSLNNMKTTLNETAAASAATNGDSWLELVRRQVGSLNFGIVQIVVHGSRVVQIERTEKLRLVNPIVAAIDGD